MSRSVPPRSRWTSALLRRTGILLLLILSVLLPACQTLDVAENAENLKNAVEGENRAQTSKSRVTVDRVQRNDPDAKIGADQHPKILTSYGGAYKNAQTERLVARIAGRLTTVPGNEDQAYRITILDSPDINAFALPGGYLYVTRGLLALARDDSEVAAVLAHEMAHVTVKHSVRRQQQEEAAEISGRVVSEILSDDPAGQEALALGQMRLAQFSRNQELEADAVGIKALGQAGYDPFAAARFLRSMAAYSRFVNADEDEDASVDFLASHPATPQRVELAERHARAFGSQRDNSTERARYLSDIEGLMFGDSPDEGYARGRTFSHPGLRITFVVPQGFSIDNTAEAVLARGPQDTAIRFDGVALGQEIDLTRYLVSGWVNGIDPTTVEKISVGSLEAARASATVDRWDFDVTIIRSGTQVFRFIVAAPLGSGQAVKAGDELRRTFRPMTNSEAAAIKPLAIRIVTPTNGETIDSLAARMEGTDRKLQLFRVLNGLQQGDTALQPDQKYKIVAG